jgi:hypothetical protein
MPLGDESTLDARTINRQLLDAAYSAAAEDLDVLLADLGFPHVNAELTSFSPIDARALAAFRAQWVGHPSRRYLWSWTRERQGYQNRSHLSVKLVEGNPAPHHPLRGCVLLLVAHAAETFCGVAGIRELWFVRPVNPRVQALYADMGYALAYRPDRVPYCRKEIAL